MLIKANALQIPLKDKSVQCCVTSPPYWGLRSYKIPPVIWDGNPDCKHEWGEDVRTPWANRVSGPNGRIKNTMASRKTKTTGPFCSLCGAWIGELGLEPNYLMYVAHMEQIFKEVYRVLKDDGTLWLNLGDCFATGAGKVSHCPGGGWQGDQFKKYFGRSTPGSNLAMEGMTQPNRMPQPGLKPKDLCGIPWRVAFALQSSGWYLRCDIIWSKMNPMPESVKDRPIRSHEYIFLLTKSEKYYYNSKIIEEPQSENERRRRLLEQARGLNTKYKLKRDQSHGQVKPGENGALRSCKTRQKLASKGTRNKRSVWEVSKTCGKVDHFATFPRKLIEPCILAGSPEGSIVLDPFVGSGTTVRVAQDLGRIAIGMDLGYQDMAAENIGGSLFKAVVNSAF